MTDQLRIVDSLGKSGSDPVLKLKTAISLHLNGDLKQPADRVHSHHPGQYLVAVGSYLLLYCTASLNYKWNPKLISAKSCFGLQIF